MAPHLVLYFNVYLCVCLALVLVLRLWFVTKSGLDPPPDYKGCCVTTRSEYCSILCRCSANCTRSLLALRLCGTLWGTRPWYMLWVVLPVVWPCLLVSWWLQACRGGGSMGGGVALIRTSPQPLCHFYSGTSLGGPHFIGEVVAVVVGGWKSLYAVMHYSQHRCWCDPRWHRHAQWGKTPPLQPKKWKKNKTPQYSRLLMVPRWHLAAFGGATCKKQFTRLSHVVSPLFLPDFPSWNQ